MLNHSHNIRDPISLNRFILACHFTPILNHTDDLAAPADQHAAARTGSGHIRREYIIVPVIKSCHLGDTGQIPEQNGPVIPPWAAKRDDWFSAS